MPQALANPKTFSIDRQFLDGQADVQLLLQGPDDNAVVQAIVANGDFPAGKLALGDIKLAASGGAKIPFSAAGGRGSVQFTASADGFFQAGVYPDPVDLVKDLSPDRHIADTLGLAAADGSRFLMLRCGYDAGATAKGAMALAQGLSVNFGGSVSRNADYAVIHEFGKDEHARDVLEGAIKSWILPNRIDGPDRLQPRTWIVTEVDGSIALNLGVQAGYDYSWMREFPGGVLKGDLGLKVQLAANAALGFSANGTYALALSRESDAEVIRLRLFKLDKNGWNFAFNASAGEQVTLPDVFQSGKNIDDLISAVFGTHVAQLVEDLRDPRLTTASGAAKFIEQRGMKEFQDLTGIQVDQLFNAGKAKVDEFVKQWTGLTHQPATMLAAILKNNQQIDDLMGFLQQIKNLDENGVKGMIKDALSRADFFQSPIGQWLESAVETTPLAAVLSTTEWQTVKDLSGTALDILNGKTLQMLIDYEVQNLGLDVIQKVKTEVDAFNLDAWLQSKLADFLGKDPVAKLVLADVQRVQSVVNALLSKADQFYAMARQAVQKKYEIDFTSTYQMATTNTALVDVAFDFAANPGLLPTLQAAIDGDMRQLLLQQIPGVKLNTAVLTHDINRRSHSDLTMPFLNVSTDDVSDSVAKVSPVEDHGRVLMYEVDAKDETKDRKGFFHAKSLADSKLSLIAKIPVNVQLRRFSEPDVNYAYSLRKAVRAMSTTQLQQDMTPLVNEYLSGLFGGGKPSLADWVHAVDLIADPGGAGNIGETLFSFDVGVAPGALDAWFNASSDPKAVQYQIMSQRMQARLRQMVSFYFFRSPAAYANLDSAGAMMAYAALPPTNGFDLTDDNQFKKFNGDIYFALDNRDHLAFLMGTGNFQIALQNSMRNAAVLLRSIPELRSNAGFYDPTQAGNVSRIITAALRSIDPERLLPDVMGPLLLFEYGLIQSIANAAVQLARFRSNAASNPADAIRQLASFGDKLVQAFNDHLGGNLALGDQLRPLGTALMLEAARGLSAGQGGDTGASAAAVGLFRLTVVSSTPPISLDDLVAGTFSRDRIVLQETLVSPRL